MKPEVFADVLALVGWACGIGVLIGVVAGMEYADYIAEKLPVSTMRFIALFFAGGLVSLISLLLFHSQVIKDSSSIGLGLDIFGMACIILSGVGWVVSRSLYRRQNRVNTKPE